MLKDKYYITNYFSSGSFGKIYNAIKRNDGKQVIVKIENINKKLLEKEYNCYKLLRKYNICPNMYDYIITENYNVLTLEDGGISLNKIISNQTNIKVYKKHKLTHLNNHNSLVIAYGLIRILKYIHMNNIIHRDIKPQNFLIKTNINNQYNIDFLNFDNISEHLNIIDFGLSTILTSEQLQQKEPKQKNKQGKYVGTLRYCSISAYNGYEQSYKDDFESIIYLIIYCFQGFLPWQTTLEPNVIPKNKINLNILFSNVPVIFKNMFTENRQCYFNEIPDYDKYLYNIKKYFNDNI